MTYYEFLVLSAEMNAVRLIAKNHRWLFVAMAGAQILAMNAAAQDTSQAIQELKKQIQALTEKV
ncbi:MAG: hypothetical protein ABSA83_21150, partial [Verrucomicrobiota bacterium]